MSATDSHTAIASALFDLASGGDSESLNRHELYHAMAQGHSALAQEPSGVATLDDLTDVVIVAPANGHALIYNSATGKWENQAGGGVAGVTTFNGRSGAVVPLQADYDGFFLTPAEGNAAYSLLGHTHPFTDVTGTIAIGQIANSLITYAKIQNVSATDKVLGRATAGAGVVEEIACTAAGRALIDDTDAVAQRATLGLGALAVKATVATADIDNDAVTYAKIQNVTTARLLGRTTAGAGDTEEISVGAGLALAAGVLSASAAGMPVAQENIGPVPGSGVDFYPIAGLANSTVLTATALAANTLYAMPFIAPGRGGTLDKLLFNVTTLLAGNARIGLYDADQLTGLPTTLLDGSAAISTGTAGVKTFAVARALTPGRLYFLAICADVAVTIRTIPVGGLYGIYGLDSGLGTAPRAGISKAFTFAALPNPFGTTGLAVIAAAPIPALSHHYSA